MKKLGHYLKKWAHNLKNKIPAKLSIEDLSEKRISKIFALRHENSSSSVIFAPNDLKPFANEDARFF